MKHAAFAAIGFGAALVGASGSLAADPSCEPVALVDGDPALVPSLRARLAQRGIAIDEAEPDGCAPVRATVIRQGSTVLVTVVEPSGASVDRSVTTSDVAATWIETRVRHDVGAPLLAVRARPAAATTPPGSAIRADIPVVATAATVPRDRMSMALWVENGTGDESSSWRTYAASACVRLGPTCVGVLGRVGQNDEVTHSDGFTFASRSSRDLLATAAVPFRLGRVTVLPSVAAGVGWMTTRQIDEPLEPLLPELDCATDPDLPPEYCELPPPLRVTTRGGRFALGLSVSVPLGDRVALDLGVWHEWLQGSNNELVRQTAFGDPDDPGACPPDREDPAGCMDFPPPPAELVEYPGEPKRLLRAGLGVRVGLP